MHQPGLRLALLLGSLSVLSPACNGQDDAAADRGTPAGFVLEGDGDRIALLIGIDDYPKLENGDLHGCVADVESMQLLFSTRFGFKDPLVLVNEQATRKGIGAALDAVLEAARAMAAEKKQPTVLLYYAGHGSRVLDQEEGELGHEPDTAWDETWVSHDSSWEGENDIRDDELRVYLDALVEMGAQVLFISDSCHSGTVHRGADFARARQPRGSSDAPARTGPSGFLHAPAATRGGPAEITGALHEPVRGFVSFTACSDKQLAHEHKDEYGEPCGRFTWVLRRALAELTPSSSYEDLYRRVDTEFVKQWPDRGQAPQLHATAAKKGEIFLAGGYAPQHARVLADGYSEGEFYVDAGYLHGALVGARAVFYPSIVELTERRDAIGFGEVIEATINTSLIELDEGGTVPVGAVARVDAARMGSFRVALDEGLPDAVVARLQEMHEAREVSLAKDGEEYRLYVHMGGDVFSLYGPNAIPGGEEGAENQPKAVWSSSANSETSLDELAEQLGFITRFQRLMSLNRNAGQVEIALEGYVEGPSGQEPLERALGEDGVQEFVHRDRFRIRFTNHSDEALYLHLLYVDSNENGITEMAAGYPNPGKEPQAVAPGSQRSLPGFWAIADEGPVTTTLKLIATSEPIDIHRLVKKPKDRGTTRSTGMPTDPFVALLDSALHGSDEGATRGIGVAPGGVSWATTDLVYRVSPKPKKK